MFDLHREHRLFAAACTPRLSGRQGLRIAAIRHPASPMATSPVETISVRLIARVYSLAGERLVKRDMASMRTARRNGFVR
jgi:hypothetical protein